MSEQENDQEARKGMTSKQTYNVVTDTVTGPNVRLRDNLIQGVVVAIGAAVGAVVGGLYVEDRTTGTLLGLLVGLIVSVILSGTFLMVFRGVRHLRGRHD